MHQETARSIAVGLILTFAIVMGGCASGPAGDGSGTLAGADARIAPRIPDSPPVKSVRTTPLPVDFWRPDLRAVRSERSPQAAPKVAVAQSQPAPLPSKPAVPHPVVKVPASTGPHSTEPGTTTRPARPGAEPSTPVVRPATPTRPPVVAPLKKQPATAKPGLRPLEPKPRPAKPTRVAKPAPEPAKPPRQPAPAGPVAAAAPKARPVAADPGPVRKVPAKPLPKPAPASAPAAAASPEPAASALPAGETPASRSTVPLWMPASAGVALLALLVLWLGAIRHGRFRRELRGLFGVDWHGRLPLSQLRSFMQAHRSLQERLHSVIGMLGAQQAKDGRFYDEATTRLDRLSRSIEQRRRRIVDDVKLLAQARRGGETSLEKALRIHAGRMGLLDAMDDLAQGIAEARGRARL